MPVVLSKNSVARDRFVVVNADPLSSISQNFSDLPSENSNRSPPSAGGLTAVVFLAAVFFVVLLFAVFAAGADPPEVSE